MRPSESSRTINASSATDKGRAAWRRRQWVVDSGYQLRAGIVVGLVAMVLLVLLNASLILPQAAPHGSGPAGRFARQHPDGMSWALILAGSAVLLGGVTLIGVLESHRTAGAAYAIRRAVEAIGQGQPEIRIQLRRGDHLQELARSVNRLAETIDRERSNRG